ncbi:MAG: Asp23/Gls24 family envelope stress response protein [Lachnospiraceae bacterium]|nr:Asp23/Gls24 family envelope stress response protein [Lachnospiraceae bacterium]
MEQNLENTVTEITEKQDVGTVKIADDVVALIAAFAAVEVEGVHSLAGGITLDILNKGGTKKLGKGVRVDVTENSVNTQVSVILDFGYNIPVTSSNIQKRVKSSLESMTGLTVTDVNVRIVGVEMPKEEE